jgi:5'-3' exonuclease
MMELLELEQASKPVQRNLMIVDTLNLSFRYKHRGQTDFAADYLNTINSLGRSYEAVDTILACDKGSSKYRLDISPEYKQARKEKYKDQTPEEELAVRAFFEGFEKALELASHSYPLIRYKGVEADDIAAHLVAKLEDSYDNIWLISTDTDWDLLLSKKVHRFSYVSRKEFTLENFYEEHQCDDPDQYISLKVLKGDFGDGVVGIDGVGDKRAYNLIREHGDALDIYDSLPLPGKQKFIASLNASEELIPINYYLMDLKSYCQEAIAFPDSKNLEDINKFCEEKT